MNAEEPAPPPTAYFTNLNREHGFEAAQVQGEIPAGLSGTLYRNGPGIMEQFGRRYDHLFEGDGTITALRLSGGEARAPAGSSRARGSSKSGPPGAISAASQRRGQAACAVFTPAT